MQTESLSITRVAADGTTIRPYTHVGDRWYDRVGEPRDQLVDAWNEADPVVAPLVDGDEVRRHERPSERDILLVARGGVLRTVLYEDEQRTIEYA